MTVYYDKESAYMPLEVTRTGKIAAWESGGGKARSGSATLIADRDANPLTPVYVRRKGPLACAEHALFVIEEGFIVAHTRRHGEATNTDLYRVKSFDMPRKRIYLSKIAPEVLESLYLTNPAIPVIIERSIEKAQFYHCRFPMYFQCRKGEN